MSDFINFIASLFGLINFSQFLTNPNFIPIFLVTLLVIFLIILLFLARAIFQAKNFLNSSFQQIIFLVTVPKESSDRSENAENIEEIRSQIAIAESWFSTLGGLKAQRGFWSWFAGRTDHFSLEIVFKDGLIYFYIAVPNILHDYMEQQILAQFPEANVTEVEDYNIFLPTGEVTGSYLKFSRQNLFPLKTYRTADSDPLNAIANSLSKIERQDGAAIQIIARSAHGRWHRQGARLGREMQKGKTLTEALNASGVFNFYKIMRFFEVKTSEQKKKDLGQPVRQMTPMEQELVKGVEGKTSKAGLDCNIRIITSAQTKQKANANLDLIANSFSQYNYYQYGNSLKMFKDSSAGFINDFIHRRYREKHKLILNTEELASIYHFPTPYIDTPNIYWLLARKVAPPPNLPQEGLLLGENSYRGINTKVYLKPGDRQRHLYMIGMTGTGKSTLMANLAVQDIQAGHGVCVIDPHGSLVEDILPCIPKDRIEDVIYFNPSDTDRPIGLNMLEAKTPEQQDFAIQEMISIFYKLVTDPSMIGPMFEHNMRNAMMTLMADADHPGTIAEIPRIFTDKEFQKYKLSKVTDPMVRSFWEQEMAKTSDFHKSEMLGYLISKVGRFVENAMIRNIIGQPKSGFNFRDVMDNQKILLVNLAKGTTGEVNSNLLGLILVAKLQMAALTRTDMAESDRKDFFLYIDEFQNFITDSVATILAEARKDRKSVV